MEHRRDDPAGRPGLDVQGRHTGRESLGPPPPPNGWGVRILALAVPAVMVIGIVAAIALPAYVDYAKRAQSGAAR